MAINSTRPIARKWISGSSRQSLANRFRTGVASENQDRAPETAES